MSAVQVHLLGGLRHFHHGHETVELDLSPETLVRDIFPKVSVPHGEVMQVVVDGVVRKPDENIGSCSEISIFPILAGGQIR